MTRSFDERNAEKSRRVCADMEKAASTGKRVLTERERRILDMWPKFGDGGYLMLGDKVAIDDRRVDVSSIEIQDDGCFIVHARDREDDYRYGQFTPNERVERPARSVLDADGVEIEVGDTVYEPNGKGGVVTALHRSANCVDLRQDDCDVCAMDGLRLTHTRPDSWGRLEEDAVKGVCEYAGAMPCGGIDAHDCGACRFYDKRGKLICEQLMALDLVRRAKALAGAEAVE